MRVGAGAAIQKCLTELGSTPLTTSATMAELIRRPELTYQVLSPIDPDRPDLPFDVQEEINIEIKYEGYITRQERQVEQFRKMEEKKKNLSKETLEYRIWEYIEGLADIRSDLQKVFGNDIPIMRSFELYLGRLSYYWKLYKDKNNGSKKT